MRPKNHEIKTAALIQKIREHLLKLDALPYLEPPVQRSEQQLAANLAPYRLTTTQRSCSRHSCRTSFVNMLCDPARGLFCATRFRKNPPSPFCLPVPVNRFVIKRKIGHDPVRPPADLDDFVDFFRRVQTPYYEQARVRFGERDVLVDYHADNAFAPYLEEGLINIIEMKA